MTPVKTEGRTVGEVFADLVAYIKRHKPDEAWEDHPLDLARWEYFTVSYGRHLTRMTDDPWPKDQRILCSAHEGDNEGDIVFVGAIQNGRYDLLIRGKTFDGKDTALEIARLCSLALCFWN